jgi:hypothetical protein
MNRPTTERWTRVRRLEDRGLAEEAPDEERVAPGRRCICPAVYGWRHKACPVHQGPR